RGAGACGLVHGRVLGTLCGALAGAPRRPAEVVCGVTSMSALRLLIALIASILIMTLMVVSPAAAQIFVMESTVPAIRVGRALEMDATLSVPAGGHLRCVLPSGKTQTVKGPYSGKVADL